MKSFLCLVILQVAVINVEPKQIDKFETALCTAQNIVENIRYYVSHKLNKYIEKDKRYTPLVNCKALGNQKVGFRKSKQYQKWRVFFHNFYHPFPEVEHYECVFRYAL